ncbi:sec-independent protein translocase protein TatB [Brevundimonas nasdae]|uniref:Sec-independent protein translocase protein TatB n=1 Tax=Brevundimonas nasdae TaxID=172043 RepID=UPI0019137961|nr:Sec-independent protein translocase protein TatB [Brevundimonas nasdae]MBK6024118.1 twin-arginine translocase subunit TatB [Brevundimonas nasdae]MDQ0450773.1 sec-independent protein translocase protein TatB [Brevundimonas nasdae]
MGGLAPGVGGFELVVIGIVALLVVGPKDLPILMRRVGQMVAKARAMANEFRTSFDEMARQSELDDLRKEVEALRSGQGMYPLGAEAEAAFKEINAGLVTPSLPSPEPELPAMQPAPDEWPDKTPVQETVVTAPKAKAAPKKAAPKTVAKPKTATAANAKPKTASKTAAAKPKTVRKKAVDL